MRYRTLEEAAYDLAADGAKLIVSVIKDEICGTEDLDVTIVYPDGSNGGLVPDPHGGWRVAEGPTTSAGYDHACGYHD